MTDVRFTLPSWLEADRVRGVQVDVLDARLLHKGRAEVSGSVAVSEPGTYAATARLPDGRQLQGTVKVAKNDANAVIDLAGLPGAPPPQSSFDLADAIARRSIDPASIVVTEPAVDDRAKVRIASGNDWVKQSEFRSPSLPTRTGAAACTFEVPARNALQTLELYRAEQETIFIQLPIDQGSSATVEMRDAADGWLPHVTYPDPDLELLIGYVSCGLYGEALKVGDRVRGAARAFVHDKADHPIGACVGFYLSLRIGAGDMRPEWAANLARLFPWLPDALVIHVEMLARNGEHRAARDALLQLPQRGLPLFAVGLSYAVDRLSQYQHFDAATKQEPDPRVRALLDRLLAVSASALPGRPILTYKGEVCSHAAYDALDALEVVASPRENTGVLDLSLIEYERGAILKALEKAGQNRTKAAKALGLSIGALRDQLKRHDFEQE